MFRYLKCLQTEIENIWHLLSKHKSILTQNISIKYCFLLHCNDLKMVRLIVLIDYHVVCLHVEDT